MHKTILLYTAIIGVVIIIFTLFSDNSEKYIGKAQQVTSSDSESHAFGAQQKGLEQEVNSLKLKIATMNAALNHLETRFNSLSSPSSTTVAASADFEPVQFYQEDTKEIEEQMKKEGKKRFDEQIIILENNFTNESVDKSWSEEKTGIVIAALGSLPAEILANVELKATDCRSSMCRIEVEYYDETAQNVFEMQLPMLVGEDFPSLSAKHEQHEGITKGTYFLQSDGI